LNTGISQKLCFWTVIVCVISIKLFLYKIACLNIDFCAIVADILKAFCERDNQAMFLLTNYQSHRISSCNVPLIVKDFQ